MSPDLGNLENLKHPEINPDIELEPWEREVVGMLRAIDLVHEKATKNNRSGFTGDDVLSIHKYVLNDPFNPQFSGKLRKVDVKMGFIVNGEYREANFLPIHPTDLAVSFKRFSEDLGQKSSTINFSTDVGRTINVASWAHLELIRIHPFLDGNGRTARLLVDLIFKKAGLPYITDWGALNDEYKEIMDRTFKESNERLFKRFLAEKLLKRAEGIARSDRNLWKNMAEIKIQGSSYIRSLS